MKAEEILVVVGFIFIITTGVGVFIQNLNIQHLGIYGMMLFSFLAIIYYIFIKRCRE